MSKEQPLVLNSAEPIDDGGRKYNKIYFISAILFAALGLFTDLGVVLGIIIGLFIGWVIKSEILYIGSRGIRRTKFRVDNKIPYTELINQLIPILSPFGMTVEKSADKNGYPVITYKGMMYDVSYEEDENAFTIWWRVSLMRAIFYGGYISKYRKIVSAMGIIAYNVQRVCGVNVQNNTVTQQVYQQPLQEENAKESKEAKYCINCGQKLSEDAMFCFNCGQKVE